MHRHHKVARRYDEPADYRQATGTKSCGSNAGSD
jgi:hypothetical protein